MTEQRKHQRFELRLPFEVVRNGSPLIVRGETKNLSSAGVLFTAEGALPLGEVVDGGGMKFAAGNVPALVSCIRDVLAGKTYLAPAAAAKLAEHVTQVQLTPRELAAGPLCASESGGIARRCRYFNQQRRNGVGEVGALCGAGKSR